MIAVWLLTAWACEEPVPSAEIAQALDAAADRFAAADVIGFEAQTLAALDRVPCVSDPLEPRLVAALHRASGLLAFAERDTERATTAFAASRSVEPDYVFPTSIVPEVHPIREQYAAVDPERGKTEAVGAPKAGALQFDARDTLFRPVDRPTVFQRFDGGGGVADTAYLWPGDPLPAYEARLPPSPVVKPLWWTTAAAGVVSGGLFGAALASRAQFDGLEAGDAESQARIDPVQLRTNALVVASAGVAAVGLGSGVGALALTRW